MLLQKNDDDKVQKIYLATTEITRGCEDNIIEDALVQVVTMQHLL